MTPSKVFDYSSWTYNLPAEATQKDYQKLSSKLKTFVESSKFLRQGSTVDQYDPQTGKRIKRPVTNVVYKQHPDDQGLPSQELRELIQWGIMQKDKKALQEASKYHYYEADKFITQKERLKEQDKKRRKRILLTSLLVGLPAGGALAIVPFLDAKRMDKPINVGTAMDAGKMALLGLGTGVGAAGLMEMIR